MCSLTLKTAGRRLSESRMRENLTSGSRWQGMETRRTMPRRHSLTLPCDRTPLARLSERMVTSMQNYTVENSISSIEFSVPFRKLWLPIWGLGLGLLAMLTVFSFHSLTYLFRKKLTRLQCFFPHMFFLYFHFFSCIVLNFSGYYWVWKLLKYMTII